MELIIRFPFFFLSWRWTIKSLLACSLTDLPYKHPRNQLKLFLFPLKAQPRLCPSTSRTRAGEDTFRFCETYFVMWLHCKLLFCLFLCRTFLILGPVSRLIAQVCIALHRNTLLRKWLKCLLRFRCLCCLSNKMEEGGGIGGGSPSINHLRGQSREGRVDGWSEWVDFSSFFVNKTLKIKAWS